MNHSKRMLACLLSAPLVLALPACAPGMLQSLFSSGGIQLSPGSTTVTVNQSLTFQASGGTAPYQYQLSGVGSIDGNGNYQSGAATGQSQIQVTDTNNLTGSATVSVIQSQGQSYKMSRAQTAPAAAGGWNATTPSELKQAPLVRGQLVAVEERKLDSQGDSIQSRFIRTNLPHPLVRMDSLTENNRVVAARAVIEDQFLVTLQQGHTEGDLAAVTSDSGAHITQSLAGGDTYLVSMDKPKAPGKSAISSGFLARRSHLKRELQRIGTVSPNFVSRAPSSLNDSPK